MYDFYFSKSSFIKASKHIVAPWIVNFQETSFKRPSHRILLKGLMGKYARSLRNWGYYAAKRKNLRIDHSFYINMPVCPQKINLKSELDVWSSARVNLFSRKFQKKNSNVYSLPLTSRCKFDGLVPYFKNRVKQRVDLGDPDFIDFSIEHTDYINKKGDQHMIYMGMPGHEGMMEDLKKYTVPIEHHITRSDIIEALEVLKDKLMLPSLKKPRKEDLLKSYVNDKSFSGLMTSLIAGHTKKESLEFSTILAEKMFDEVGSKLTVDTSLKVVGAREKLVKYDKFGERLQTRALIQEESMISQLKQIYSRPITEALKCMNIKWESQIGIGGILLGNGVREFCNKFYPDDGHDYSIVTMDAASHDKNVCSELLIASYSILRACFPKCSKIDNHFFFFMSGHDYKRIMTDDGFVYSVKGGIQTGDPMTSLINSVCMLLEKTILYKKLNIEQPIKQVYYGDDQWEVFNPGVIIPESIGEISKKNLGIKMKDVIIKKTSEPFSNDYSKEPSFLQIFFKRGFPVRDPSRIFEKLYFMDPKLRGDPVEKLEAVMSMAYSSSGLNDTRKLVIEYSNFLRKKYNIKTIHTVENRIDSISNRLSIANLGVQNSNVRGEYEYARKTRVYCFEWKYYYLKTGLNSISPLLIKHILGKVKFSNLQKVVSKFRNHRDFMKIARSIILHEEIQKNKNNLHYFLTTDHGVWGT